VRNKGFGMIFRFLGYVFLCLAMAALAYDGTRMIADNGRLAFTSVEQHWLNLSPSSMEAARASLDQINSYIWSPLLMSVLVLPAWIVATGLGTLLYLAGYSRPRPVLPDGI
jgi:hypothetical protein